MGGEGCEGGKVVLKQRMLHYALPGLPVLYLCLAQNYVLPDLIAPLRTLFLQPRPVARKTNEGALFHIKDMRAPVLPGRRKLGMSGSRRLGWVRSSRKCQ